MKSVRRISWLAVVAAGGCHGNHARTADGPGIDAPTVNVELQVTGAPQLIEYRNGSGAWQVPVGSGSSYTLAVTNDYEYIVVCANGSAFDSQEYGATIADGSPQHAMCFTPGAPGPTFETVTGMLAQAGSVEMYGSGSSTTPNWTFTLMAPMGLNDLVAWDATSMLIHRNVPVTGPVSIGNYDLSTSGSPLQTATLTLANLGSDGPSVGIVWNTANDQAFFPGSGSGSSQVILPPSALVEATDLEQVSIAAFGGAGPFPAPSWDRGLNVDFSGTLSTTDFTLLEVLTGVAFDTSTSPTSVTWGQLPAGATQLSLGLGSLSGTLTEPLSIQQVSVTPAWVAATASASLSFDVPSDDVFVIDTTVAYSADFLARLDTATTTSYTAYGQPFNVAARAEATTGLLGDRWRQLRARRRN